MQNLKIRILLNGKKSAIPEIRSAVSHFREQGHDVEVRVTWEYGDNDRLVREAVADGVPRLVAAGGDGTVNEVADALVRYSMSEQPELAILPLGTANDFATACQIPTSVDRALNLAIKGTTTAVDIVKANKRHFINVATGGFGAQVTTETPVQLKNFLGGGAYTLTGIAKALNFSPVAGVMRTAESEHEFELIVGAICNGRQAGGGQPLAPDALLNDGLLDVVTVSIFPARELNTVITELMNPSPSGLYVKRFRTSWLEIQSGGNSEQINLDGEPYNSTKVRFEVVPEAIRLVLPKNCPCIK